MRGHQRSDDIMEDYCDSVKFKTHPLFSSNHKALQIILFFDECELCNPLGSFRKKHKLGEVCLVCFHTYVAIFIHTYCIINEYVNMFRVLLLHSGEYTSYVSLCCKCHPTVVLGRSSITTAIWA